MSELQSMSRLGDLGEGAQVCLPYGRDVYIVAGHAGPVTYLRRATAMPTRKVAANSDLQVRIVAILDEEAGE